MANEIQTQQPQSASGAALYAVLDGVEGRWNGTAYEAVQLAHWGTYAVALTEAAGTGFFAANLPSGIAAGTPLVATVFKRAGGSPAATDPVVGAGTIGSPDVNVDSVARSAPAATGLRDQTLAPASDALDAIAGRLLVTPANKLATDSTGKVTATNGGSGGASAADVAAAILANPSNKLATDGTGKVGANNFPSTVTVDSGSKTGVTLADGSITSAKFTLGAITAAATGLLERLVYGVNATRPPAGWSVSAPKTGTGNLVVKGPGNATVGTHAIADDGTTQTIGGGS